MLSSLSLFPTLYFRGFDSKSDVPLPRSTPNAISDVQDAFVSMQRFKESLIQASSDRNQPRSTRRALQGVLKELEANPYPSQERLGEIMAKIQALAVDLQGNDLGVQPKSRANILGTVKNEVKDWKASQREALQAEKQRKRELSQAENQSLRSMVKALDAEWQQSGGERTERLKQLEDKLYNKLYELKERYPKNSEKLKNLTDSLTFITFLGSGLTGIAGAGAVFIALVGMASGASVPIGLAILAGGAVSSAGGFKLANYLNKNHTEIGDLTKKPRALYIRKLKGFMARRTAKQLDHTKAYVPPEKIQKLLVEMALKAAGKDA